MSITAPRHPLIFALLVVLIAALAYLPGLSGDFLFDDFPNIVSNPKVHAETLDWETLARAARAYDPGEYGRPLATLGFALDYAIGGKNPLGYKIHSLVVHLFNALLMFALMRWLLALPRAGDWPAWAPLALALAWAAHPLQVSSVLYVVQRMETLSLTFVLLGLLAYLRGRLAQRDGRGSWGWLAGSAVLAGLGMLSKETAILFPAYALALELTLLRFDAADPRITRRLRAFYLVGTAAALALFLFYVLPRYMAPGSYAGRDFSLGERLLTQLRVLPMYLSQIVLPLPDGMTFYYDDYRKSTGWLDPPTTLAGGLLLTALLALAAWLRPRRPLAALGILWFFAAHLLTSNVIRLELVFEHRNYFALAGVLLAIAGLLRGRQPAAEMRPAAGLFSGMAVAGLLLLCLLRSATWGDPILLATDLAARNPQSARASSDLATLYAALSRNDPASPYYAAAMAEFERGSLLATASPLPEQGLLLMAAVAGRPADPAWWDRLIHKVRSRPTGPQEARAVIGLVQQRLEGIPLDDARLTEAMQALLERKPTKSSLYALDARYLLALGRDDAAGRRFVEALERSGDDVDYARRLVAGLLEDGRVDAARHVLAYAHARGIAVGDQWTVTLPETPASPPPPEDGTDTQ